MQSLILDSHVASWDGRMGGEGQEVVREPGAICWPSSSTRVSPEWNAGICGGLIHTRHGTTPKAAG